MSEPLSADPMMQPCRRGCGELVHLENDGFHVCPEPLQSPRLRTAHDVRFLRPCVHCADLGDKRHMLKTGKHWWHGRCYIKQNGLQALIDQGLEQTGHLTLNDIGTVAMQALLK